MSGGIGKIKLSINAIKSKKDKAYLFFDISMCCGALDIYWGK